MSGGGPDQIPVAQQEAVNEMRRIVNPSVTSTWDDAWKVNATPWDAGNLQPPLKEIIEGSNNDIVWPKTGRVLVPGCGSGYDVAYLASSLGLTTIGLDASQTAIDKATTSVKGKPLPHGEIVFEVADFFTYKPQERFNLVYDYTFFVAIPPSRRNEWGIKMAELINPGGFLIALVFPIDPKAEGGPPFYVRPEHYNDPLSSAFEKVVDKIPETSAQSHIGRERVLIWRRK